MHANCKTTKLIIALRTDTCVSPSLIRVLEIFISMRSATQPTSSLMHRRVFGFIFRTRYMLASNRTHNQSSSGNQYARSECREDYRIGHVAQGKCQILPSAKRRAELKALEMCNKRLSQKHDTWCNIRRNIFCPRNWCYNVARLLRAVIYMNE